MFAFIGRRLLIATPTIILISIFVFTLQTLLPGDHPDPIAELRRIHDVAHERFVHVAEAMPMRANFSGTTDRTGIDAAIAAADAHRKAEGRPSRSFATDL